MPVSSENYELSSLPQNSEELHSRADSKTFDDDTIRVGTSIENDPKKQNIALTQKESV